MTALDSALAAAHLDKSKGMDFYSLFLNTELYLPLNELPSKEEPQKINPILIDKDGKLFLMLFDEESRLVSWAKRQIPYAQIPGFAIVQMMDPEILYVLNVGTEHYHQFVKDEIEWLRKTVEQNLKKQNE